MVATQAALAEATGDVKRAMDIVTAAVKDNGPPQRGKAAAAKAGQQGLHWLLQPLAALQLQVGGWLRAWQASVAPQRLRDPWT